MTEVVSLGRQSAWNGPLNDWLCEPSKRPPVPNVLESIVAAGGFEWLVATVIPGLLCLAFIATSKSRASLFIWLPILVLHLAIRFDALNASFQPWGACGLHRDEVFGALLLDIALVILITIGGLVWGIKDSLRDKNV